MNSKGLQLEVALRSFSLFWTRATPTKSSPSIQPPRKYTASVSSLGAHNSKLKSTNHSSFQFLVRIEQARTELTDELVLFDEKRILRAVLDLLHNLDAQGGQVGWSFLSQGPDLNRRYKCEYILNVRYLLRPELRPEILIARFYVLTLCSQFDHCLAILQLWIGVTHSFCDQ